jgi:hypothetical protein
VATEAATTAPFDRKSSGTVCSSPSRNRVEGSQPKIFRIKVLSLLRLVATQKHGERLGVFDETHSAHLSREVLNNR